jgi:hypothetical protein
MLEQGHWLIETGIDLSMIVSSVQALRRKGQFPFMLGAAFSAAFF